MSFVLIPSDSVQFVFHWQGLIVNTPAKQITIQQVRDLYEIYRLEPTELKFVGILEYLNVPEIINKLVVTNLKLQNLVCFKI